MAKDYSNLFPLNSVNTQPVPEKSMIERLGWQSFFLQQISIEEMEQTPPVRVVEVHRSGLHVVGDEIDELIQPQIDTTVGDWLLIDPDTRQSVRLLDRMSIIQRRAPGTGHTIQLIAANIDTVFIVTSCNKDFNIARLERYVALAFEAEITPVILLTKTDLAEDMNDYVEEARTISELMQVVALDARGVEPTDKLSEWCKLGKTVAFLGSSGVGKSTLTNALAGNQSIATQGIREDDAKGRHTTTSRQLHMVSNGCLVLDTPGMRELQLTDAASGIDDLFSDIFELSQGCKFSDCSHLNEPGCAVLKAVEAGELDQKRTERWRKLKAEDAFNSYSLSERRAKDKAFGKKIRGIVKGNKK